MFRSLQKRLAILWVLPAAALTARGEYRVVDLGALTNTSGGKSSSFSAINSTNQIAGTNSPDGTVYNASRYANGAMSNLGTLGGSDSFASAINDLGQIAGRSTTAAGTVHSFIWTPGGTGGPSSNPQMVDLNPQGAASQAHGINASGQVAGYMTVAQPGRSTTRAFRYSAGVMTPLPLPAVRYDSSFGYAINDQGTVVGEAYTASSPLPHGFFNDGTTSTEVGDLGGGSSSALAINNKGRIVGYSSNLDGYDHAYVYADGSMTDLYTLGGHYSYANAINNNQIVGGSFIDDADHIFHAFISDGVTMTDLNTKITSKAADWVLSEAKGINDQGSIVGTGTLAGAQHAFLLNPLLPGDANADGKVDFADLVAVAQHYKGTEAASWEEGDFDGDGAVGFTDLVAVAQNYGSAQAGELPLLSQGSSVPEPCTAGVATAGVLFIMMHRRRRVRQRV